MQQTSYPRNNVPTNQQNVDNQRTLTPHARIRMIPQYLRNVCHLSCIKYIRLKETFDLKLSKFSTWILLYELCVLYVAVPFVSTLKELKVYCFLYFLYICYHLLNNYIDSSDLYISLSDLKICLNMRSGTRTTCYHIKSMSYTTTSSQYLTTQQHFLTSQLVNYFDFLSGVNDFADKCVVNWKIILPNLTWRYNLVSFCSQKDEYFVMTCLEY